MIDSTISESQKLSKQNQVCGKGAEHSNLPIVMICLQKQCARKRLCCLTCIDDLHCKHQLISLKKFQSFISDTLSHNKHVKNRDDMLELLQTTKIKLKQKINEIQGYFVEKSNQIISIIQSHFSKIQDTFTVEKNQNIIDEIIEEFTEDKVESVYKLAKDAERNMVKSINQVISAVDITSDVIKDKIINYRKEIDKNTDNIVKTINSFKITGKDIQKTFSFNSETKAVSLVLANNCKTVKRGEGAGGYPIAVVDQPFTETNCEINISIMEQPANKSCWMGVCILSMVKNLNYQSCYGLGKGTWAIDQVGQNHQSAFSWSHHEANFNSAPKVGFQFGIGDVINIKVNFAQSTVIFTKNNQISFEQPIKLNLGPIHAFAGPTNLNDVLAIL